MSIYPCIRHDKLNSPPLSGDHLTIHPILYIYAEKGGEKPRRNQKGAERLEVRRLPPFQEETR